MKNRSVPSGSLIGHVICEDIGTSIDWLSRVFGFLEHYRYGAPDEPQGAQLLLNEAVIMLTKTRAGRGTPNSAGNYTMSLTVFLDDVDSHYERARAAGARIVEEINETMYGERQYAAEDLNGHIWLFSQHVRDVDPAEWGAHLAIES